MIVEEEIVAKIYLFPKGHGGRENDYTANAARLGIVFHNDETNMQYGCEITNTINENLVLDKHLICKVHIMNIRDARPYLLQGNEFKLYEGSRRVGTGVWKISD